MDQVKGLSWLFLAIRIGYYTLAAYGLFLVVLWWKDDSAPIVFEESAISKPIVRPGESVLITQRIIKTKLCFGSVYRWLEGDCGFKLLSNNDAILSVGPHNLSIPVTIPLDLLSGPCRMMSRHQYACNPLDYIFNRKIYYSPPIHFEVVK